MIDLTAADFDHQIEDSPTLVDFWAPWCQPCRMLAPVLDKVSKDFPCVCVAKVNTDDNQALAARFGVSALPTIVAFRDGKEIGRLVGLANEDSIRKVLGRLE